MNEKDTLSELRDYLKFLVREYLLEENDSLTPHAQRLKEDIRELFRK
jgi:hypothetical protein